MKGLCKRAEVVPYFGFHTLRHLMASLLADNPKVATKTIQKILGHANIQTTEIYVHSIEGAMEKA
jgi:integrase